MSNANITSPEVLRDFRVKLVKFDGKAKQALASVKEEVSRVTEWLKREQDAHWKRQIRKWEEAVVQLRIEYLRVTQSDKYLRGSSGVDEKKALERAIRMKELSQQKLENVKKWSWAVEHKAGKLLQPCNNMAHQLEHLTPRALARLDTMMESIEDYLKSANMGGGGSVGGEAASGGGGGSEEKK